MGAGIVIPVAENINIKSSSRDKIVFRRYPCTLWTAGVFICCCSIYLIYHLSLGPKHGTLFQGYKEGYWWQYAVAIIILLLGLIFIYGGKVESVVVDKEKCFLELHKTNVFCLTRKKVHDLSRVNNVRCVKKGHDGVNMYTVHYIIQAEFRGEAPVKILESTKREKIIQQTLLIRNFLGMFTSENQLQIYDMSTRI